MDTDMSQFDVTFLKIQQLLNGAVSIDLSDGRDIHEHAKKFAKDMPYLSRVLYTLMDKSKKSLKEAFEVDYGA